ncbi:MAG: glycosyltransferase family 9 protein [Streptosporangiaceae bacterium]|nr:glycosyltransferase family 9 protein [Streptosporangiaceae bacterium]
MRLRIVLLRALGLGDFLTGVPALRAVRTAFPDAGITLAAPAVLEPLAGLCGAVDEVADTAPLRPLASRLHHADLAVNLHGRGQQSTLLLAATRPRRLLAFAHEGLEITRGLPGWRPAEHEVARWCRLLTEGGIPADPDPAMLKLDPPASGTPWPGAVVIHAGASAAARRWPPDRWAEVATALTGRRIVLTGTADEGPLASFIAGRAGLPPASVLAGQLDLTALAALTAHAALVLSGDTGIAHLAAAFGAPAVTLAGPVPPALWGPPPRPAHRVLWAGEPGRSGDAHASAPDPRLLAISPADVIAAAETVLSLTKDG